MKTLALLFVINIFLISCGSVEPYSIIDGNYEGVYYITHNYGTDSAYTMQAKITFEFSKGQYHCIGEKYSLPPESLGKYRLNKRKITLIDNGRHDANIDPTLLLTGDFDYFFNGERLNIEQVNQGYRYYHKINLNKQIKDYN